MISTVTYQPESTLSSASQGFLAAHLDENRPSSELAADYQPSEHDIMCGRGKGSYNRVANRKFRALVREYLTDYTTARSKVDKSAVIDNILDRVQASQTRFVVLKDGRWFEISEDQAREKIGHALREAVVKMDGADTRIQAKKVFDTKQSSLLLEQKAIFDAMVRGMNKKSQFKQARTKLALAA